MVWGGPHHGQTGRDVYAFIEGEQLERYQALVVIHRQNDVGFCVFADPEKPIRGVWTADAPPVGSKLVAHGYEPIDLFCPDYPAVTGMWIQSEHGYRGVFSSKIIAQARLNLSQDTSEVFRTEGIGNGGDWDVGGCEGHTEAAGRHDHQGFAAGHRSDILGMSRYVVSCLGNSLFRNGGGNDEVCMALEASLCGPGYGVHGLGTCLGVDGTKCGDVRSAHTGGWTDQIQFSCDGFLDVSDYVPAYRVGVKGCQVCLEDVGVPYRDEPHLLKPSRFGRRLEYDFGTDAIGVSLGKENAGWGKFLYHMGQQSALLVAEDTGWWRRYILLALGGARGGVGAMIYTRV